MKELEFNKIYNMNCVEGMKHLPDNSIGLIITDPPFAIDFKAKRSNYHRKASRVLEGYNEIPKEKYYDFTVKWMREVYRILKESGSMYVFSGWNNLKDIYGEQNFDNNYHKCGFSYGLLKRLLKSCGIRNIKRVIRGYKGIPFIPDCLHIEGVKS